MTDWQARQDLVRNCKGASASIILLLLLSEGQSLTSRELQRGTRYSDKPITDALSWLEPRGIVQYNGRSQGWSLATGARQLDIFTKLLNGNMECLPTPAPSLAARSVADRSFTQNDNPEHETLSTSDNGQHAAVDNSVQQRPEIGNIPCSEAVDRKYSDLDSLVVVVLNKQNKKHFKNNNKQQAVRKYSDLDQMLRLVSVRNKTRELWRLKTPLILPLAWWFELDSMDWIPANAGGWIYTRLRSLEDPPDGMVKTAVNHLNDHGLVLPVAYKCSFCGSTEGCYCDLVKR